MRTKTKSSVSIKTEINIIMYKPYEFRGNIHDWIEYMKILSESLNESPSKLVYLQRHVGSIPPRETVLFSLQRAKSLRYFAR